MTFGWTGKALYVDLTTRKMRVENIEKRLLRKFLGGRGLASFLLYTELEEKTDAFSPENLLLFAAGPMAGTMWPTASRITVAAKSPLTGGLGYAHAGGYLGPELKFAGYDLICLSGRSKEPVYLRVEDENSTLRDAAHLWTKTTAETIKTIQGEVGRCHLACIGPAGENRVRIASIITDRDRAAARCGLGAVMGSKKLKAVAVTGTKKVKIAHPESFVNLCKGALMRWSPTNPQIQGLSKRGTPWLIESKNEIGDLPAKNHQTAQFPWVGEISGETIREKYFIKPETCFSCPIHCRAYARATEGKNAPISGSRPEYESIDALGPMCWIADFSTIMKANELCNDLGLDTISAGVSVAFAMELYEKHIITKKDSGLSLEWGNAESMLKLIEMIAYRWGLGDILAEGTARAAVKIGGEAARYAMHVKKMEIPRQEPRTLKAFALGHAVSNRGADHLYALPTIDSARRWDVAKKLFPDKPIEKMIDTKNPRYKPQIVIFTENYCALTDALGTCKFTTAETYVFMPSDYANALSTLTGEDFAEKDVLESGERIVNLERCFNVREGFSRKDDVLPERFLKEPYKENVVELDEMLSKYYRLRGWSKDGIPKTQTLRRLGLNDLAHR